MRKFILEFLRRGWGACGVGPLILGIIYLALRQSAALETLTINQACIGIFSTAALAFVAGGMNAVYRLERLPLMAAISIHGGVLYLSYLVTYLLNDWLEWGSVPILVFSGIFLFGYLAIWVTIYSIIRRNTQKLNESLRKKAAEASE